MENIMTGFTENAFFGIALTLITFEIGRLIKQKWNYALVNPLVISIVLCLIFLKAAHIDVQKYTVGAEHIKLLLTPATIAFAIPLYRQTQILKDHLFAIMVSILAGSLASILSVFVMAKLLSLPYEIFISFAPKSVTTPIAMGIADELGGVTSITIISVVATGILGSVIVEALAKLFKIHDKVAFGLGTGTCSHAIGTTTALQIDEISGAMSSLSIVVAGVLTVILVPIIGTFY